jgi:hypothetical protein
MFERDADPAFRTALTDEEQYALLKPPSSIVVRYGAMNLVGEFPYDGSAKPGCGSKLIVRSPRGTEMGEMLTSTCPNSGCGKSVSRKQMLDYIENSGGRDYPFFTDGRVLRIATKEDMDHQARLEQSRHELRMDAKRRAEAMGLMMKVVDAEALLGGERDHLLLQQRRPHRFPRALSANSRSSTAPVWRCARWAPGTRPGSPPTTRSAASTVAARISSRS